MSLYPGERLFDRLQVRRLGRQDGNELPTGFLGSCLVLFLLPGFDANGRQVPLSVCLGFGL